MKGALTLIDSQEKAILAYRASLDKKAKNPVILDLQGLTFIADYFVICSGESTTQVKALAENIETRLRDSGVKASAVEGVTNANWILMDYGDVIVHVFEDGTRTYYDLEKLWLDAPRLPMEHEDKDILAGKN